MNKTYLQYFWSDGIGTPALIFAIIGVLALIFPDKEPHTLFWGVWISIMTIIHIGQFIRGKRYFKGK